MNDDAPEGDGRQRTAATKVPAHHKSEVVDSDDRAHDPDSEPESVPSKFFSTKTLSLDVLWMWCLTYSLDFWWNLCCFDCIFPYFPLTEALSPHTRDVLFVLSHWIYTLELIHSQTSKMSLLLCICMSGGIPSALLVQESFISLKILCSFFQLFSGVCVKTVTPE